MKKSPRIFWKGLLNLPRKCSKKPKTKATKADEIILWGGATRMPQIKARIEENFSVTPKIFDPDEAVAKGAAIYGGN
ncbi:MAG: Hsp70 family protein [Desulfobacterales bacterium]